MAAEGRPPLPLPRQAAEGLAVGRQDLQRVLRVQVALSKKGASCAVREPKVLSKASTGHWRLLAVPSICCLGSGKAPPPPRRRRCRCPRRQAARQPGALHAGSSLTARQAACGAAARLPGRGARAGALQRRGAWARRFSSGGWGDACGRGRCCCRGALYLNTLIWHDLQVADEHGVRTVSFPLVHVSEREALFTPDLEASLGRLLRHLVLGGTAYKAQVGGCWRCTTKGWFEVRKCGCCGAFLPALLKPCIWLPCAGGNRNEAQVCSTGVCTGLCSRAAAAGI